MQENSYNEFDNFYRKAASDFPLQTESADWESVLEKLEKDNDKKPFWFNKKVSLLTLLLLMLLSSTVVYLLVGVNTKSNSNPLNTSAQNSSKIDTNSQNKAIDIVKKNDNNNNENSDKISITDNSERREVDIVNNKNISVTTTQKNSLVNSKKLESNHQNRLNKTEKQLMELQQTTAVKSSQLKQQKSNKNLIQLSATTTDLNKKMGDELNESSSTEDLINKEVGFENIAKPNLKIDPTKSLIVIKKDIISNTIDAKDAKQIALNKKPSINKGFYIGILYSFDNTFAQKEKHKERGENFGLSVLLGYQISKKISIETGLGIKNREYYTNGTNFNKSILNATGNIVNIESENTFIDVPINFRYNIVDKKKIQIFSNLGTSSHLINYEKYEFEQENGGVYNKKIVEFSSFTTNLFSTLNVSLGCEFRIKKLGSLRVQPYYNFPIKSFAKSGLNIVSKGVQVGWIYQFNKK